MANGLLAGKRGLVMGVANDKSIAWACAEACAAQGASLIFNYVGEALQKRVGKLLNEHMPQASMYPCDVTNDAEIDAFFESVRKEWDRIDFLIHSIAFADREDLKDQYITTPRKNFAMALDISAYSLVALARGAAPMMTSGGSIITMTYYGAEKVVPRYNVMGVAKAALEASARYLAYDLGPQNIRVNAISAGPLKTLSASAISGMRKMFGKYAEITPLRRGLEASEVANTAVYLLSDLSSAVTGEVVHVDCGYHAMGMYGTDEQA
jgi:enoyl-[acyl-carrier protein] reductase I